MATSIRAPTAKMGMMTAMAVLPADERPADLPPVLAGAVDVGSDVVWPTPVCEFPGRLEVTMTVVPCCGWVVWVAADWVITEVRICVEAGAGAPVTEVVTTGGAVTWVCVGGGWAAV